MAKQGNLLSKTLVIGILILLIGMSVVSSSRNVLEVPDNAQLDSVDISELLSTQNSICYGYCINDPSGQLIEGPISFSLNDLGNISQLWGTSSLNPMVGGAWIWDGWFCCEYGSGKLWKIDYDSGYMIEIGGGGIHLNGLSWSSDDIIVGSSNTSLYMIDEATGEQTFIGSFGLPEGSKMGGIAFDFIAQRLYGVEYVNNRLYEIDQDNGETEYIGQLGIEINGTAVLDYNVEDDCLYLSTFTDQGELYNVDKDTGECTLIGELQGGAEISALTIDPDRFYLPTANFNWSPHYPQPGETIVFNASSSYDEKGSIVLYEWDWNYDLIFDETTNNPIAEYIFEETGYFPVTLLVHSNNGMDTQQYVVYVGDILYVGGTGEGNYTTIQSAIDDANPGDTVFVYNGTYYESNIIINKTLNLFGEDNLTTIIKAVSSRDYILIFEANNINISGFTIKSYGHLGCSIFLNSSNNNNIIGNILKSNISSTWGIYLNNSDYNIMKDNIISNRSIALSFIHSSNNLIKSNNIFRNTRGISFFNYSNNNTIRNNKIMDSWSQGASFWDSNNIILEDNIISNNGDSSDERITIIRCNNTIISSNIFVDNIGLDIYSSDNNIITDNSFINDSLLFWDSCENIVSNNTINEKPLIYLENKHDMIIKDAGQIILIKCNNITIQHQEFSNTYNGIELWDTDNCLISDNNISKIHYGLDIHYHSNNNIIKNNIISGNTIGIRSWNYNSDNIIQNNIITDNEFGFDVHAPINNTIIQNNITRNKMNNIVICDGLNNTINGNNISSSDYVGLYIDGASTNNTIVNNDVTDNRFGMYVLGSNNTIIINDFLDNIYGITLLNYSSDNILYHNNFIKNENNAEDKGSNIWNYSYPSGGNYWDDYNGVDNFSGSNQDIPGSDGIGDTPYEIEPSYCNNWDNYPLMEPWGDLNLPPIKPSIVGPIRGKVRIKYEYSFSLLDPNEDKIHLRVDWGSGTPSKWYGPYDSGTIVKLNHTWSKKGTYSIRAQTQDSSGLLSDWEILTVTIPRNIATIYSLLQLLLERFPLLEVFLRALYLLK